jgi:sialate O-acetylesterase
MYLHRYLKVPVGIVNVARGGTLGQTWCLREGLDQIEHVTVQTVLEDYDAETAKWEDPKEVVRIMSEWEESVKVANTEHENKVAEAKAAGKKEPRKRLPKKPGDPRSGWSPPAGLFNATVMPIRDLRIRGVLYYQGENNNFMGWTRYEHTFPLVPLSFRKAFGEKALPFGCISQPGWGTFGLEPEIATVAEGYAIVRDIQRRALKNDPHAAMIATYPAGNSYIHPGEKLPVAEYASLWALARVYQKKIVHRANEYKDIKIVEGRAFLFFDSDPVVFERWKHIENNAAWQVLPSPREGNAEIRGFIIAGRDQRWYPAQARQQKLDGEWTIEVSSPLVSEPVAVRYGWANWPTGNLVGRERLPLPTFRTDDWPIPEGVNYSTAAKKAAETKLKELKALGARQAADRKLRQALLDLPVLEADKFKGDGAGLLASKLARIEAILAQMASREVARIIEKERPELKGKLEALRKEVETLKK